MLPDSPVCRLWSSETRWIRSEVREVSVTLGGEYCYLGESASGEMPERYTN